MSLLTFHIEEKRQAFFKPDAAYPNFLPQTSYFIQCSLG